MNRERSRRATLREVAGLGTLGGLGVPALTRSARAQGGYDGWFGDGAEGGSTGNYTGTVDETGADTVTIAVGAEGNGGPYAFSPAAVRIDPGTEVTFQWRSDNHNVVVQDSPDGTEWPGITEIHNTGHEASHTFETPGIYTYYCDPHLALGMKGAIVVGEAETGESAGGTESPAGDGGAEPPAGGQEVLPGNDFGRVFLGLMLGTGLLAALGAFSPEIASTIRRSRDASPSGDSQRADIADVTESPVHEPREELAHQDYDPTGTAWLIVGYFLVLVVLWIVMYFLEFLGNGPTVVG